MTTAAEFLDVSCRFGSFTAVDSISLPIAEGKLTTLLGPSGCGKTTSLRMLAGYESPTSGTIRIGGEDSTRKPPEKRGLGMVFQSYALFPHMSVADNVGYGLKLRKVPRAERRARVGECLDLVGLGHVGDRRPRALSGGQQQRVALARAIAIRPTLLLLDEPLSNLDARLRVQMRAEIRRIQRETGLTVVLVTHDQDEALEMSDEMVVMQLGRIMRTGAPADIFARPESRFVADFLGYENFLTARDGSLLTVRPELLVLSDGRGEHRSGDVLLKGTVSSVAYRGTDLLVRTDATDPSGAGITLSCDIRNHRGPLPVAGQPVTLTAPREHVLTLHD